MIYFLSDLHLGLGDAEDKQRQWRFQQWLKAIGNHATDLYLVGDIFDYWFDYRFVIPRHFYRIVAELANLADNGVQIHYIIGNHDFGHWQFFEQELGAQLHQQDLETVINHKKFYIAHGDDKLSGDWGYRLLRSLLRNRLAQRLYRWIHPDIGIALASLSSRTSRHHTQQHTPQDDNALLKFAKQKIDQGFDYVIMGHIHHPCKVEYGSGTYINLGDWLYHDTFARFDGTTIELLHLSQFLDEVPKTSPIAQ